MDSEFLRAVATEAGSGESPALLQGGGEALTFCDLRPKPPNHSPTQTKLEPSEKFANGRITSTAQSIRKWQLEAPAGLRLESHRLVTLPRELEPFDLEADWLVALP